MSFKYEKAIFLAPWNQSKGSALSSQCLNVKGSKKEGKGGGAGKGAKSSDRMTG